MTDKFLELVNKYNGFEVTLGFRDDEDHFVGGKGDTFWYYIQKGSKAEFWEGQLKDGVWTDHHYKKKGKAFIPEDIESGYTISKIIDRVYFGKDFIEKDGRKPSSVENFGMKVDHYVYSFGEKAYDISQEYGVTVSYSNINDTAAGYRLRRLITGDEVKAPKK